MSATNDSTPDTQAHIENVQSKMTAVCANLQHRSAIHDRSKLEPPEKEGYDQIGIALKGLTYGSPEYRESLRKLKPTIEHHYAHNSHHPEHWVNGVDDMSLLDVIEMLCDWKAAGERHADGDIVKSIAINTERFKMSPQLARIMMKTALELGWIKELPNTTKGTPVSSGSTPE